MHDPGPARVHDPFVRQTIKQAAVWLSMATALWISWQLIQPILLIFAAIVFAALLDGGARLLGRALPIGRGWRLLIVCLFAVTSLGAVVYWMGVEIVQQAGELRVTIIEQSRRLVDWLEAHEVMPTGAQLQGLGSQFLGSLGRVTAAIGTVAGAITSLVMVIALGLFIAADPRLYERGLA